MKSCHLKLEENGRLLESSWRYILIKSEKGKRAKNKVRKREIDSVNKVMSTILPSDKMAQLKGAKLKFKLNPIPVWGLS